jgi:hypothetical protein
MTLSYFTCSRIVSACIPARTSALLALPCPLPARTHPAPPLPCICLSLCAPPTETSETPAANHALKPSRTILWVSGLLRHDASRPHLGQDRESSARQHLYLLCSQQWPRHAGLCRLRTLVRRLDAAGTPSYNGPSKAFRRCCRSTLRPCAFV